jgi:hypothetical protein
MTDVVYIAIVIVILCIFTGIVCYHIGYEVARHEYIKMRKRYEKAAEALEEGDRLGSFLALIGDHDGEKEEEKEKG